MFSKQGVQAEPYVDRFPSISFLDLRKLTASRTALRVELEVSFGKGEYFWTNSFPTKLVEKHAKEIKRFKWAVKVMRWFEVFFALIPIKVSLKMFFFSNEFIERMIYPS